MDEISISKTLMVNDPDNTYVKSLEFIPETDIDMKFYETDPKTSEYLKKMIRSSYEYKMLMAFIKRDPEFSCCVFHRNYSAYNGLTIEIHHEPFTITDIIETVCRKQIFDNKYFTEKSIANEVMESHYMLEVGLVPLCPTCHELVTNNKLEIPPQSIISDGWKEWYTKYYTHVSDNMVEKYERAIQLSKKDEKNIIYPEIVTKRKQILIAGNESPTTNLEYKKLLIDSKLDDLGAKI